jgi:hypothetical protein
MTMYGGVDVQSHLFLFSSLDGSEWYVSRPARFTPVEEAPVTLWVGGWVGLSRYGHCGAE